MEETNIYTDGSCINKIGGYGVVELSSNRMRTTSGKVPDTPCTNQIAELYAILSALEATDSKNITINTDSKYAIGCFTTWIKTWIQNDWKTSSNKPVKNKPLIEKIWNLITDKINSGAEIYFIHVRAHKGNLYNEMADELANEGRSR